MQYMVWNNITAITPANSTLVDVEKADELDPGKLNVLDPDMRKFVSSKGKLLHFTGWADHLIAPMNSVRSGCVWPQTQCSTSHRSTTMLPSMRS